MVFRLRTLYEIKPDMESLQQVMEPNSIYYYAKDLPRDLFMRLVEGVAKDQHHNYWSGFVGEGEMLLIAKNTEITQAGTLIFVPNVRPRMFMSPLVQRIREYVEGTARRALNI